MGNNATVANKLFIPSGLNLEARIPKKNIKSIKYYRWFLDQLSRKRVGNKTYKPDDYIRLHSKRLEDIMTWRYAKPVIDNLIDWGIVEPDPSYQVGEYSKGYRLTDEYRLREVEAYPLDAKISEKLNNRPVSDFEKDRVGSWLAANYKDNLLIDYDGALQYITRKLTKAQRPIIKPFSALFLSFQGQIIKKKALGKVKDNNTLSPTHTHTPPSVPTFLKPYDNLAPQTAQTKSDYTYVKFLYDLFSLQMLASCERKDFIFTRDTKGHRLHTNLTNLSRHLRRFLLHETGEQLVNLDISNSQPLMLAPLLINKYKKEGKPRPADVQTYIELTSEGKFYKYLMKELYNIPYCNKAKAEYSKEVKDAFKKRFFARIFFCENRDMEGYTEAKTFKEHFPNVYQFIWDSKSGSNKKPHAQLAYDMQQEESCIIIDLVCDGLLEDHGKDFFCLTIHDSIVTVKSNQDVVEKKIKEVFFHQHGITPTITPESLN